MAYRRQGSWDDEEYEAEIPKHRSNPTMNIDALSQANPHGKWSTKNGKMLPESVANIIHSLVAPKGTTIRRGVNPGRTLAHIRTPQEIAKFLKFKNELSKKASKKATNRERRRWEEEELPVLQAQRHAIFNRGARELDEEIREIQALRRRQEMEHERRMLNLDEDSDSDDSDSDDERPAVNINALGGARKKYKTTLKNKKNKKNKSHKRH